MRKNMKKSARTGRFVNAISPVTRSEIQRLAHKYDLPLTRVAEITGVDLDTVLRHKGTRLSHRQQQRIYFEHAKQKLILPIVKQMAVGGHVITVAEIRRMLSSPKATESCPSRTIVSKALQALADEGLVFKRPPEYHRALEKRRDAQENAKVTDNRILVLRRKFPGMRDRELVQKAGIGYWELRRRITALRQAGTLPSKKRAYPKK